MRLSTLIAPELKSTPLWHLHTIVDLMLELITSDRPKEVGDRLLTGVKAACDEHNGLPSIQSFGLLEFSTVADDCPTYVICLSSISTSGNILSKTIFTIMKSPQGEVIILVANSKLCGGQVWSVVIGRPFVHQGVLEAVLGIVISIATEKVIDLYMPFEHLTDPTLHLRKNIGLTDEEEVQCIALLDNGEEMLGGHTWCELDFPPEAELKHGCKMIRIYDERMECQNKKIDQYMRFIAVEIYIVPKDKTSPEIHTYTCLTWKQVMLFLCKSGITDSLKLTVKE